MHAPAAAAQTAARSRTLPITAAATVAVIGVIGVLLGRQGFNIGAYWFIGVAFGLILQRSRLCFAGGFRDLIMSGDGRLLRALLVGMGVATLGFSLLMARFVPDPSFGQLPPGAHIQTVGLATVVGGLVFGAGMVLAGGCVSGTLWRMGEGYLNSWAAMLGILAGLWLGAKHWNAWWYDNDISKRTATWLPAEIGMGPAILLVLGLIAVLYLAVLWWEMRSPRMPDPAPKRPAPAFSPLDHLRNAWSAVFAGRGWSYLTGAVALAILGTFAYGLQAPLGVSGGLGLWGDKLVGLAGLGAELPLKGADKLAGCTPGNGATWHTIRTSTMTGLVIGAFLASVLSGEFRLRWSRQWTRYPQVVAGGLLMGYASVLAVGCTVGAFFSSIPSLALSGWLFGLAVFGGAFIGVQIVRRLP